MTATIKNGETISGSVKLTYSANGHVTAEANLVNDATGESLDVPIVLAETPPLYSISWSPPRR